MMTMRTRNITCPACKKRMRIEFNDGYKFENYHCSGCNNNIRVHIDDSTRIPKIVKKEVLNYVKPLPSIEVVEEPHHECSVCHRKIDQSEWDDFGGMCAKCENESYDAMVSCAEEDGE